MSDAVPPDRALVGHLLHSEAALSGLVQDAIKFARTIGATSASASVSERSGITMRASSGRIDTSRRDGSQSLGIVIYDEGRTGRATTQALDAASVRRAVEQAVTIARQVEPDDRAGLAEPDWIVREPREVPLFAPSRQSADELAEFALLIEESALAEARGAKVRVIDATASTHVVRWARAISDGFCGAGSASIHHRWCSAIAENESEMARDYWSDSQRVEAELQLPKEIGRAAAERCMGKLGSRGVGTRRASVLLDPRVAATLVGDVASALDGMAQYQGRTFIPQPNGFQLFAPHVTLTEDPFEPFGLASAAYDSECVAGSQRRVVDRGVVRGLFLNAVAARKLGMRSTGNADGPTNLTLSSDLTTPSDDLPAMLRRMHKGLWITEFLGGGVNATTGSYSKAAAGFWIENGHVSHPVHDVTIAGELPRMIAGIVAIGADVHRMGGIRTGSILIDDMQVAGR